MFRLEKIFQQNDSLFIKTQNFFKSFVIYLTIYCFSIIEFNSIFDLSKTDIYIKSNYFYISLYFSISYLISTFIFNTKKIKYKINFFVPLLNDINLLLVATLISGLILFIFKIDYNIEINIIFLLIFIIFNLILTKVFFDFIYNKLIEENIIQRNIVLVGSREGIKKILSEKKDKINIYKCCLIRSYNEDELLMFRREVKIPVFTQDSDVRSIL